MTKCCNNCLHHYRDGKACNSSIFCRQGNRWTALPKPEEPIWTNDKVIDFVNWYLKLNRINPRFELENQTIIDSFLNGDPVEVWDNQYAPK
jgi:hypothetical protein